MANSRSAKKRVKVNERRHRENLRVKNRYKKTVRELGSTKDKDQALKLLSSVYEQLDRISVKHRMHRNKVNRLKSRYARMVNAISTSAL